MGGSTQIRITIQQERLRFGLPLFRLHAQRQSLLDHVARALVYVVGFPQAEFVADSFDELFGQVGCRGDG